MLLSHGCSLGTGKMKQIRKSIELYTFTRAWRWRWLGCVHCSNLWQNFVFGKSFAVFELYAHMPCCHSRRWNRRNTETDRVNTEQTVYILSVYLRSKLMWKLFHCVLNSSVLVCCCRLTLLLVIHFCANTRCRCYILLFLIIYERCDKNGEQLEESCTKEKKKVSRFQCVSHAQCLQATTRRLTHTFPSSDTHIHNPE